MSASVQMILSKYVDELEKIYGTYLKSVILYGSYARGDFSEDSDIDIMILLEMLKLKDEYLITCFSCKSQVT